MEPTMHRGLANRRHGLHELAAVHSAISLLLLLLLLLAILSFLVLMLLLSAAGEQQPKHIYP